MHCLHCHFRSTSKLGPEIYFCIGPRGSLKRTLSNRFKSWPDIFFVDIIPPATIKILTAQYRISARYHLSYTNVKAHINN